MIAKYDKELEEIKSNIEKWKQQIIDGTKAREDPESLRSSKIEKIPKLKSGIEVLSKTAQAFERTDPKKVEDLQKRNKLAKDSANRWTDNLFEVKSWISDKNPNLTGSELEQQFPVLKNLDNLE